MRNTREIRSHVILKSDLLNVLDAIIRANERIGRLAPSPQVGAYSEGFRAAIETVAAAFDLDIDERLRPTVEHARVSYETDHARLISDIHSS